MRRLLAMGLAFALVISCGRESESGPATPTPSVRATPSPAPRESPAIKAIPPGSACNAHDVEPALDPYYCWAISVDGVLVLAGNSVNPMLVNIAAETVSEMLTHRPEMRDKLAAVGTKLAIAGQDELITDIPELRHLQNAVLDPDREYEDLAGFSSGVIAVARLLGETGQEAVVGLEAGSTPGAGLLVHEFAHTIQALGLTTKEWERWRTLYSASRSKGLWEGSYAGRNQQEFFAELTQCYFGVNPGQENGVNGADALRAYDPNAADFLEDVYGSR